MFDLFLIGIGTGNPEHVTAQGARAIRQADLILIPRKGANKGDLAGIREEIIATVAGGTRGAGETAGTGPRIAYFDIPERNTDGGYRRGVDHWHDAIAAIWRNTIAAHEPAPQKVALLIWGDPSLYDSSLRIAARLAPRPKIQVIPGVTALQALTAAFNMPLNDIGAPVLITTGRRLRESGWPVGVDTVAVMLDGQCSFQSLAARDHDIWWGAFLGMPNQLTVSGPLARVGDEILRKRAEARALHGWIMDIYLLRHSASAPPAG